MQHLLLAAATILTSDPVPEDEDVVAGWAGFAIFIGLILAVAVLGYFLTKQLKRTEANRKAGVFGPVDDEPTAPVEPRDPQDPR